MNIKRILAATLALLLAAALSLQAAAPAGWTTDYDKALATAKQSNKPLLVLFTGSDWCPYCVELDKKVLKKKEFKDYAAANLVLVYVDFPNGRRLPKPLREQNDALKTKFSVKGYPTPLLISPEEKVLGRINHGVATPAEFVAEIDKAKGVAPAQ